MDQTPVTTPVAKIAEAKENVLRAARAFAAEQLRPNGCTGYGPKFTAMMTAALELRAAEGDGRAEDHLAALNDLKA